MAFTFSKEEKITGRKAFEVLASSGSAFFSYPFRILWMPATTEQKFPARVAFAVPKKNFKLAVNRNKVKRLLREAYRLNKDSLYSGLEKQNVKIVVLFIYTPREIPQFTEAEDKIIVSLRRLLKAADGTGDAD